MSRRILGMPLLHIDPAPNRERFSKFAPEPPAVIPADAPTEFAALTVRELIERDQIRSEILARNDVIGQEIADRMARGDT